MAGGAGGAGGDQAERRRGPPTRALHPHRLGQGRAGGRSLYDAAGLDRKTADGYEHLLRNLFAVDAVPAWFTNRLRRLVKQPKRYVVDAALATSAIGIDAEGVLHDQDLLIELSGRRLIAIEIQAAAAPGTESARHLAWLRDQIGERFAHGLVLHAGRGVYELGERITAAPIGAIWARSA